MQLLVIDATSAVVVELSDMMWNFVFDELEANVAVARLLPGLELLFGSPY